jgi:hypothetical protein
MKQFNLFFILIFLLSYFSSCGQKNKDFKIFINKFEDINLPINVSTLEKDKQISLCEFKTFINLDSTNWKYGRNFFYTAIAKFKVNKFYAIIFERRLEFDGDTPECRIERVLCIYENNGNLKSFLIIGGYHLIAEKEGCINSEISSDYIVKVVNEEFTIEEKDKVIKQNFSINFTTGNIEKFKK